MTDWASKTAQALQSIAANRPRVHCLTNAVAPELTANMLLAIGAQPSVTWNPEEITAFLGDSDALLVNLGTLTPDRKKAVEIAAHVASDRKLPWVLDPVKVHRSPHRLDIAQNLLSQAPSIVRCNRDEAACLDLAGPALIVTGAVDRISKDDSSAAVANGDLLMDRVTAMGCAGSAVVAAFSSVLDNPFEAAVCGLLAVNVAGEVAAEQAKGPGSFKPHFLDALYNLDEATLQRRAEVTL